MTTQDPAGWFNTCTRTLSDGSFCGLRYCFTWHASAKTGKRFVDHDSTIAHQCREVVG